MRFKYHNLFMLGLLLSLGFVLITALGEMHFLMKAVKIKGHIVGYDTSISIANITARILSTKRGAKSKTPYISFQTPEGRVIEFTGHFTRRVEKTITPVVVLYLPFRPDKAQIYEFDEMWAYPIMGIMSSIVCVIGFFHFRNAN